nr:hypothetical protein Iba_chr15aCG13590 [Ipomoea batatas]
MCMVGGGWLYSGWSHGGLVDDGMLAWWRDDGQAKMAAKGEKKMAMGKQEEEGGSKSIGIFPGPKKGSVFPKQKEFVSTMMAKKIVKSFNNKKKKKYEDD